MYIYTRLFYTNIYRFIYVYKPIFVRRDLIFFPLSKRQSSIQTPFLTSTNQFKYIFVKNDTLAYELKRKLYHLLIYTWLELTKSQWLSKQYISLFTNMQVTVQGRHIAACKWKVLMSFLQLILLAFFFFCR